MMPLDLLTGVGPTDQIEAPGPAGRVVVDVVVVDAAVVTAVVAGATADVAGTIVVVGGLVEGGVLVLDV